MPGRVSPSARLGQAAARQYVRMVRGGLCVRENTQAAPMSSTDHGVDVEIHCAQPGDPVRAKRGGKPRSRPTKPAAGNNP